MFTTLFGLGCFTAILARVIWEMREERIDEAKNEAEWMQHNRCVARERARHARALGHR
jgi:hypothetical protein